MLNGAGEMTGSLQVAEWGVLETPIYLTATMAVGRVFDGAVPPRCAADPAVGVEDVVIPVVGECDDSWLSEARVVQVEAADAGRALAGAARAAGGRGRRRRRHRDECLGYKGGIGTSSRVVPSGATVGVLVLANFGAPRDLRIDGVPVGRLLGRRAAGGRPRPAGSCIVVVATDAPLHAAQLERVARRAGLGLARTGSVAHHGSGEIFLAFSTARGAARSPTPSSTRSSPPPSTRPRRPSSTRSGPPSASSDARAASPRRCRATTSSRCSRPTGVSEAGAQALGALLGVDEPAQKAPAPGPSNRVQSQAPKRSQDRWVGHGGRPDQRSGRSVVSVAAQERSSTTSSKGSRSARSIHSSAVRLSGSTGRAG